jgi:hypothetical protein
VIAATGDRSLYDILVVAHVACALIGFGSLMLSGVYGFSHRDPRGAGAIEEARRYFGSPGRLELLVIPVPFLGAAALAVEPHGKGAGQLWAVLAEVVWLIAVVVVVAVARPAERKIRAALTAPEVDAAAVGAGARRLGWAGVVTDVAFFAALMLMVFQPR